MKRTALLIISIMLLISPIMKADEGMWLMSLIGKNYNQMKALGFKLTSDDIYSVNHASLKDAVVALDHGMCTGEIVSNMGLMFTNHHCGYEDIQAHSTVENDFLTDGFWATSLEEELPNPGKTVSFLIRMDDVTSKISWRLNDKMDEKMRDDVVSKAIEEIENEATEDGKFEAKVVSMYEGNSYYLFVYKTYKDIRLVGAPPSSIGKFGGDTDNWMWPRHTGDFSIFRIYTAPDGSPAEYSPENVPLKPIKYLKINISGVKEGDFTMIMGYPGTTKRYLTAAEIEETMKHENDIRFKVRTEKLNILKRYMDKSNQTRIQYAAKYAESANYWKYSEAQNISLEGLDVIKNSKKQQKEISKWINATKERKELYGNIFKTISTDIKNHSKADVALNYWFEAIYQGAEVVSFALQNFSYARELNEADSNKNELINKMQETGNKFFKDYNSTIDKELFEKLVKMYYDNVDKQFYGTVYKTIQKDYNGDINKYADDIYSKSFLTDKGRFDAMLVDPSGSAIMSDIGFQFAYNMLNEYWAINDTKDSIDKGYQKSRRLYVDAFIKYNNDIHPEKLFSPDANSTMRLTYGTVGGYTYKDQKYDYYSTLDQYIKKENPSNEEFFVKERTKQLYNAKDYGQYAGSDGILRIDFLTNNDITGGNSGSPVLNANGELIGIAFDGNWEGMSGDIAYEPNLEKTICVDIRFVLWTIDKYANAKNLINELDIVK